VGLAKALKDGDNVCPKEYVGVTGELFIYCEYTPPFCVFGLLDINQHPPFLDLDFDVLPVIQHPAFCDLL
jgi:hypothetical protein